MDFWLLVPHVEVTTVLMTSKKLNGLKKKKKKQLFNPSEIQSKLLHCSLHMGETGKD